jgi:hypothetical protein
MSNAMVAVKSQLPRGALACFVFAAFFGATAAQAVVVTAVALSGNLAPGAGGAVFNTFGAPSLNNNGETQFLASLRGPGVTGSNSRGLFTSSQLVVRTGDTAPGTGGATFSGLGSHSLNDRGDAAIRVTLSGAGSGPDNETAIYTFSSGSANLVARGGDTAPNSDGAKYWDLIGATSLNSRGQTVYQASLSGPGVTEENDQVLFT